MKDALAGYETTAQAAQRLGVHQRHINTLLIKGRIKGAKLLTVGKRAVWRVPADTILDDCRRYGSKKARDGHCDTCGIILTRSGDDNHPNDAPDAGRCWFCREQYGLGPVGPEVTGECAEEREEVIDGRDDLYRSGAVRPERH